MQRHTQSVNPVNSIVLDVADIGVMIGFNEWMAVVECSHDALEAAI